MKQQNRIPRLSRLLAGALCAAALTVMPGLSPDARAALDAHYTSASLSAQEQTAGNLVNSDRARYALPALTLDPALCRIARIKSEDMRANGYFAHVSPTYGDVRQMLTAFGYSFEAAGENIAHHRDVEKAQAAFLSSPGHRRNVLSTRYTRFGVGMATDGNSVYLTQIFCR